MQYTFGQAKEQLSQYNNAYGVTDVGVAINTAIQALASMSGWECLRKVVRFSSAGPVFTLPQGYAGLVRACVNGRPKTLRGQDFRFLQSGPGDLESVPVGFERVPTSNILDMGYKPVMIEPNHPFKLLAFSDSASQPVVVVRGIDAKGKDVKINLTVNQYATYDDSGSISAGAEPERTTPNPQVFQMISSVTIGTTATDYVTLYAVDEVLGTRSVISMYHPQIKAPTFRQYVIPGYPSDRPVEILVEARIDPLPLVSDSDVLPFSTLQPIEWMIMADWKMKASEVDAAQKYQNLAAQWLKAQEIVDNTFQTKIVLNSSFDDSMGEVSMEAFNI